MDLQNHQTSQKLAERFEFRSILPEETDQAVTIEHICFPPNEACSHKAMTERIAAAPELFLVAIRGLRRFRRIPEHAVSDALIIAFDAEGLQYPLSLL